MNIAHPWTRARTARNCRLAFVTSFVGHKCNDKSARGRESEIIMSEIAKLQALEILDSRGNPTLAVTVTLANGVAATAKVPSGASTGKREAVELRDGDKARYGGKGVLNAKGHVEGEIQSAIRGFDANDQKGIDKRLCELDGTQNKGRLGANAILGVSLAVAHAAAKDHGLPLYATIVDKPANLLPTPGLNVLNGGKHADSNVDFQEFMISPVGAPSFSEGLRAAAETFHALKSVLTKKGYSTAVGDEGGFAPQLKSNEEPVELILEAIQKAGYKPGKDVVIMLDPAASEFFDEGNYIFAKSDKSKKTSTEMIALWKSWLHKYPEIWSLEDGIAEDDNAGWQAITKELGSQIQLVGDDNFVTNPQIFMKGIKDGIANAILIKLQSDRNRYRNARLHPDGPGQWLWRGHLASLGGNRRHEHRGSCGRRRHGPDQDRLSVPR